MEKDKYITEANEIAKKVCELLDNETGYMDLSHKDKLVYYSNILVAVLISTAVQFGRYDVKHDLSAKEHILGRIIEIADGMYDEMCGSN